MRAIVTGGNGFIGSFLVDTLLHLGWNVVVIDPRHRVVNDGRKYAHWATEVQESIAPQSADVIFHLAGHVGPVGVLDFAGDIVYDTVIMADIVSSWAKNLNAKLIFTSTSEVYGSPDAANKEGDHLVFPPEYSARREYAIGKLAAESLFLGRGQGVMIRPFNVAGPRQSEEGGFVLPRFIQQSLGGKDLTVYTPGTQRRTFTHVKDVVDGIMLAYQKGKPGSVYNLGNDENVTSMIELAQMVLDATGSTRSPGIDIVDPKTIHGDTFREAAEKTANSDKARDELGWFPYRTMETIVEDTVWYWQQSNR